MCASGSHVCTGNIGTLTASNVIKTDWVGGGDTLDYYKFTVAQRSDVTLLLTGMTGNANIRLLNSGGTQIDASLNTGNTDDLIATTLNAGTYYAQIEQGSGDTNYTFAATATVADGVWPVDGLGRGLSLFRARLEHLRQLAHRRIDDVDQLRHRPLDCRDQTTQQHRARRQIG